jgi:hypothetical protein
MALPRLLLAGCLACAAILLLVMLGLPAGHSSAFNYAWSVQYSQTFAWTNPLPRYLPGQWAGFGGYDFFFYPPLPFWFIAAVVDPLCPGCSAASEYVLGSSVILVASGLAMFAFLRSVVGPGAAAFGAIVYTVLPYHLLLDWFERQAAGEFTAYAFIPLVALGVERVRQDRPGGWILALGVAGTALSHLPTTLLAAHVFAAVVVVLVALAPGGLAARLGLFARLAGFVLLGLAVAGAYWIPAVVLLDTVSPATLFDPYFEAWRWLYGGAEAPPSPGFAFRVLVSFLACAPIVLGALLFARGPLLVWILVPAALVTFLNIAASEPIWRAWIIAKVQFPWRLMTLMDFATGLAAAVLAARMGNRIGKLVLAAALLVAVVPTSYLAGKVQYTLTDTPPEDRDYPWFAAAEYMSPEMTETLRLRLAQDSLGHFDQRAIADAIAAMAVQFRQTHPEARIIDRRPRALTVLPPQGAAILSLPVQYWFLWQAETATGEALTVRANPVFGTLDVIAPAGGFGDQPVVVSLALHPSELAGWAASLLGLLALLATARRARARQR